MNDRPIQDDEDLVRLEMPCECDCGYWFDLNDGYTMDDNSVVCRFCYEENTEGE